ncbi:MAG: DNA-binding response regulator [Bdellovibrionales bacterium CG10_big_fil_rev_8_21_14_0_10_45_34]|nr:MAG: DNA-binding response regulator [Bdellovibrionales bacterium CG10_big_fil_rev_8_21_14_0_10_45_34]
MEKPILLVEDEKDIRELMALHIRRAGFEVDEASDGAEGIKKIDSKDYKLIVVDWMVPLASGLEILRYVREKSKSPQTPVLMVTARVTTQDIVFGLESGADDYVTKPFDPTVLVARVRALVRRSPGKKSQGAINEGQEISLGELKINPGSHEVFVNGEHVLLTPSEFKLLHALAANQGRVLTRDQLIHLVQGEGVMVVDRAIDTHVFGLRKKLGDWANFVETVRGVGYRINYSMDL